MNFGSLIFGLIGALLMTGLFWLFKPEEAPAPPAEVAAPAAEPAIEVPAAPPAQPAPVTADIVVKEGRRVSGPEIVALREGDEVILTVTSDKNDELHLHGYDLHLHLHAGQPGTLKFTAKQSGRFAYELHKSHLELGALEVQPK